MSEGFTQPTSPTSGLAPYGGDAPQRRKKRLKRYMQKTEETTMSNYETLLTDLRAAVTEAAAAPEGDRDEILNKAFTALDEGLVNEVNLAIDESVGEADPIVGFTSELAKSAGDNEELAKGLTDVADFAFALQGIERMMERMAAIGEGKMCFPSLLGSDLGAEDKEAQKEHAHAILDIITPYYSMGLVVLQRLTGATVADESGEAMSAEDEDEVLKADMSDFFSRVSHTDITPEAAFETLTKAFTPPPDDGSDNSSPDDTGEGQDDGNGDGMDDGDVDPLETIKRLAAAIMLQVSAISDSDDTEGNPEDQAPGQETPQAQPPVTKADLAQLMKAEVDTQLKKALDPLVTENAQLREQVEKLGKMAAPVGNKGAVDPQGREGGPVTVEDLAKMAPDEARRAVFKAALSNPTG